MTQGEKENAFPVHDKLCLKEECAHLVQPPQHS